MKHKSYKHTLSRTKFPDEDDDEIEGFDNDISSMAMKDVMREEERFGKWIGLAMAIMFWLVIALCYISSTSLKSSNTTSLTTSDQL